MRTFLLIIICLIHNNYSIKPANQSKRSILEFRPLRPEEIPSEDRHCFAAVKKGENVKKMEDAVGHVFWYKQDTTPDVVLAALPEKKAGDVAMYIDMVEVQPGWRKNGVASKMFPKALEDIRRTLPNTIAVYLEICNQDADAKEYYHIRVHFYEKYNFTAISEPDTDGYAYYLYKYPTPGDQDHFS